MGPRTWLTLKKLFRFIFDFYSNGFYSISIKNDFYFLSIYFRFIFDLFSIYFRFLLSRPGRILKNNDFDFNTISTRFQYDFYSNFFDFNTISTFRFLLFWDLKSFFRFLLFWERFLFDFDFYPCE